MEKRLLLAIVLSFAVLVLYQLVFVKKPPPQESFSEPIAEIEKAPRQEPVQKEPSILPETEEKKEFQPISEEREEQIVVETPLYQAVWINRGAQLKSWKLKKYKDENKEDLELISVRSLELGRYPFLLSTDDPDFDNTINRGLYKSSNYKLELTEGQEEELRFEYADEAGTRIEKIFIFHAGTYSFETQINVWKNGQKIEPRLIWGPSFGNLTEQEQRQRIGGGSPGVSVYAGNKVDRHEERKFKPEKSYYNFVDWVSYDINYFTALFIAPPQKLTASFLMEEINQVPYFFLTLDLPETTYIGPKDIDKLTELGHDTKKLIKFGLFGWIAEIMLRAIKYFHNSIPNWGFCIIILTLIIKILFFPLTYSSTKSMAKMQELQPKMKAIRAKYKKAKQDIAQRRKMNEEIMKLYKEHGVNPAGGCLPILIQLPIFWGFFRMLVVSLEFRQSSFIFWIKDLSVKDPYYVTPILMGITQFINQKMTPTSADPTQQRMMLIMPVVMTIFFMNFSSGLVLYWLTNNILQIGQQYIMNRLRQKQKRESHGKRRKK
ncbi:MAG: membrane protein insertase YidC [Candidatus Aminicenantes bacterium]|nr:membrane protein insertase YidC [Candidatus Aminicenantes bacterium]MDH5383249.1 membrane protein insertase YidC [Candidatus Aminicenantes bacterium]MDH5743433.1 membrane protein insertase YidC [Candidatus Aminicenantes bacterium]